MSCQFCAVMLIRNLQLQTYFNLRADLASDFFLSRDMPCLWHDLEEGWGGGGEGAVRSFTRAWHCRDHRTHCRFTVFLRIIAVPGLFSKNRPPFSEGIWNNSFTRIIIPVPPKLPWLITRPSLSPPFHPLPVMLKIYNWDKNDSNSDAKGIDTEN